MVLRCTCWLTCRSCSPTGTSPTRVSAASSPRRASGTLEVLLHLVRGAGNPVSTGSSAGSSGGFGGPVTVPSTTVPVLTVPTAS